MGSGATGLGEGRMISPVDKSVDEMLWSHFNFDAKVVLNAYWRVIADNANLDIREVARQSGHQPEYCVAVIEHYKRTRKWYDETPQHGKTARI
jgi:hypothetical protein